MQAADLDRIAELLDPNVHWGTCVNRDQALNWYRSRLGGVRADVTEVDIDNDTIEVGTTVHEDGLTYGARQAFRVAEGAIVEIRPLPERT